MTIRNRIITSILFAACLACCGVHTAHAASLDFSPASGTYTVGQTFSVDVVVSSPTQAVNAFSGDIMYPADKLTAVDVSKSGTIVNFWETDPVTVPGDITYGGIVLNPGYTGARGQIVRVTFKAIAAGKATLGFKSSSILANDGLGTNVISDTGAATFMLTAAAVPTTPQIPPVPSVPSAPALGVPSAPDITSVSHPDQTAWYSDRAAVLAWGVPAGVTSVSYVTNADPSGMPSTWFGLTNGRTTPTLVDGVWYTHVRFRNAAGVSAVAHFKTQIDGTSPTALTVKDVSDSDTAVKRFEFSASDALSGIAQYGVSIDGGAETIVPSTGDVTSYSTEALPRGTHTLSVKAYDRAGNSVLDTSTFQITKLDPPTITSYQKELRDGDFLIVEGTSYPDSQVAFTLVRQLPVRQGLFGRSVYVPSGSSIAGTVMTDGKGSFVFASSDRLPYGLYSIEARVVLADGTQSDPATIVIPVVENLLGRIMHALLDPTGLIVIFALLFIGVLWLFIRTLRRYRALQMQMAVANDPRRQRVTD